MEGRDEEAAEGDTRPDSPLEERDEREVTASRASQAIKMGREAAREGKQEGGIRGAADYWQGKNLGRVGRKMERGLRR